MAEVQTILASGLLLSGMSARNLFQNEDTTMGSNEKKDAATAKVIERKVTRDEKFGVDVVWSEKAIPDAPVLSLPESVKVKAGELGCHVEVYPYKSQDGKVAANYERVILPKGWNDDDVAGNLDSLSVIIAHKDFGLVDVVQATANRSWQIRAKSHFNPAEAPEPTSVRGQISKLSREMGISTDDLLKLMNAEKERREAEASSTSPGA